MKATPLFLLVLSSVLLSGCSATMVSYHEAGNVTDCPPVVSVHSIGSDVTITDGLECKAKPK